MWVCGDLSFEKGTSRLTNELMHKYEKEKTKLNELGQESLAKGIPLSANETVLAQSRKVDELVTRFYVQKMDEREQGNR